MTFYKFKYDIINSRVKDMLNRRSAKYMKKLGLNEIRDLFLNFYESKEHFRRQSFSLIPKSDKSLLIINSGMAPLKAYFAGIEKPPAPRMVTCQKCIRTDDIDNVGITSRHGTFFEMLGSFSFGDYFKKESITWGWEFLTKVLHLPEEKLWVTVYEEDEEAYHIWKNSIGFPENKIVKLGKDDNFWEIGTGPCGPCSEIYFDRGEKYGCDDPDCKPGCDCDRYIEFWNHVFTQFNKKEDGTYENLAHPNIDTGMGLERISCIMQETVSIFDIDTIRLVLNEICKIACMEYKNGIDPNDVSIRIITDHIRAATFMISDGIMPSNEGRGYVLRRLIRRAYRHGRKLGISGEFLSKLVDKVVESSEKAYPELGEQEIFIKKIISQEEEKFIKTLNQGLTIIDEYINDMKTRNERLLDGEKAFKLHDTYGFPFETTKEILLEQGFDVNKDEFDRYMKIQKSLGKSDANKKDFGWKENNLEFLNNLSTEFLGYELNECESKVISIFSVEDGKIRELSTAHKGMQINLVLDRTVFYAKGGGQVSDIGNIVSKKGLEIVISDVYKVNNSYVHVGKIQNGEVSIEDIVTTKVDIIHKNNSARNHSCTHLLHKSLRELLGEHVSQAGSHVDSQNLRFDFSHFESLTKEQIAIIEKKVNEKIDEFLPVTSDIMSLSDAEKSGAIGLFEDKYGDTVRVVSIGDYSKELCGGIHVSNSGQIGGFKILSEKGISAGIRRIEAITGKALREYLNSRDDIVTNAAKIMKTTDFELENKINANLIQVKELQNKIEEIESKSRAKVADDLLDKKKTINGVDLICHRFNGSDVSSVKEICDNLRDKHENVILVFTSSFENKNTLIIAISKNLVAKGYSAGNIIKEVAKIADGRGGGKPEMAQAGIKLIEKSDEIFTAVSNML